jgi:hypothetical protein
MESRSRSSWRAALHYSSPAGHGPRHPTAAGVLREKRGGEKKGLGFLGGRRPGLLFLRKARAAVGCCPAGMDAGDRLVADRASFGLCRRGCWAILATQPSVGGPRAQAGALRTSVDRFFASDRMNSDVYYLF